jgi:hypothetical protein
MKKELAAIDVSSIEELQRIKAEQDVILERLEKMEEKKESVSEEVYRRVHVDYETRLKSLDDEAGPLKDQARLQYAELKTVLGQIESALATAKMDREELQLRHELGEFDDDAYAGHIKEHDAKVKDHQSDLGDAEGIRDRFLSAFHSEDELEAGSETLPPTPPAEVAADASQKTAKHQTLAAEPAPEPDAEPNLDKTTAIPIPKPEPPQPPDGSTMILQWPKLLVHSDTGHAEEHAVVGAETVLGSGDDCDIVVEGKKVSAKHAAIALGPTGHLVRDLKSQVGTLVNGVEVTERELANGDTIQIGEVKMTFTV